MGIRFGFLAAALAFCLLPTGAKAVSFPFEGTTPDTGVDVRFLADLSISGDTLTLVLTNDSLNHSNGASPSLNPNDLLTSFYFDVFDGSSRPTLTYASAIGDVCLTDKDAVDDCTVIDKENDLRAFLAFDGTWQFRDGLDWQIGSSLPLTFGVGTAGNATFAGGEDVIGGGGNGFSGNIVDGFDYGLYAPDATTANLDGDLLTTGSITYTWSGATGFDDGDIVNQALFGLGTKPDSFALVPEPGTGLLLAAGLLGMAWQRRRM
jgi:hypothetical protein